jgi:two-component system, OmpR family, sensor histidine kinase ChvG
MQGKYWRFGLRTKLSITMLGLLLIPFILIKQLNKTEVFLWQQAHLNMQDQLRHLAFSFAELDSRLNAIQNLEFGQNENGFTFYLKPVAQFFRVDANFSDWQSEAHQKLTFEQDGTELQIAKSNRLTIINLQIAGFQAGLEDHLKLFVETKEISGGATDTSTAKQDTSAILNKPSANLFGMERKATQSIEKRFQEGWSFYLESGGRVNAMFKSDRLEKNKPRYVNDARIKGRWQQANNKILVELSVPSILITSTIKLALRRNDGIYPLQVWSPVITLTDTAQDLAKWTQSVPLTSGSELRVYTKTGGMLHQRLKIDMAEHGYSNLWLSQLLQTQAEKRHSASINTMIANFEATAMDGVVTSPDSAHSMMLNGVIAIQSPDNDVAGYLSLQQSLKPLELVQQKWLSSWLGSLFWVMCLIAILLLGYATLLIWRVRQVATSLKNSVDEKGIVVNKVAIDRASDELGELSHNIADVVDKLAIQQEYLRRLSSKLSHELRTPIAVVRGALENIAYDISEQGNESLKRAEHGISRLSLILTRMSEATRIEESLTKAAKESISLTQMLKSYIEAINASHDDFVFDFCCEPAELGDIEGAPELIMQACDKLISNAMDFCNPDYPITISVITQHKKVCLSVVNVGPHIEGSTERLFQPLVSERPDLEAVGSRQFDANNSAISDAEPRPNTAKNKSDNSHLGLGLYVVKIICDYHQAQITVDNTRFKSHEGEFSAVKFTLIFDEKTPR